MSIDQIYISATRYSSPALHGDAHWRAIKLLPQQQPGQYTATVDGRRGVISIDAKGWWFTEQTAPTPTAPEVAPVPPLAAECVGLRALLREWLLLDHWEDDEIAPRDLVLRTQAAVDPSVSPAKAKE